MLHKKSIWHIDIAMFTFFQNPKSHNEDIPKAIQTRKHEAERVFNEIFMQQPVTQPQPAAVAAPPVVAAVPVMAPPMTPPQPTQPQTHIADMESHHNHRFVRTHMIENCPHGRVRNHDGFVDGAFVLDAGGDKIGPINESVRRPATQRDAPVTVSVPPRTQNTNNTKTQSAIDFSKPFDFGDLMNR